MAATRPARLAGGKPLARVKALDIPRLARDLISGLAINTYEPSLHDVDGEPQEFLFDAEVDGLRVIVTRRRPVASRPGVLLSPREREIARMVAKGYPNKTIATVLEISSWTVDTYLRRIFAKLAVGTRAAMVARLIGEGLLTERHAAPPPPGGPSWDVDPRR